jgi:hypothetical protein
LTPAATLILTRRHAGKLQVYLIRRGGDLTAVEVLLMGWSLFVRHMKKQGVFLPISMNILMRRSINIARQAGKPEGWLGRLIACMTKKQKMIFPGKYIPSYQKRNYLIY